MAYKASDAMPVKNHNYKFILLLGFVSLFSDMVYEGARSIAGPYLGMLGASGAVIGFIFGFGELIGFSLRIFSGYFVDQTGRYWLFTITGYLCNIVAIPLLALTGNWKTAVVIFIIERIGKALRNPARDAMLSYASNQMGRGRGFGIHQFLDQLGAMLGPVVITLVLVFNPNSYHLAFAFLSLPALFTLITLLAAQRKFPHPEHLEAEDRTIQNAKYPSVFWIYLLASSLLAAGFADYPLIAYHFQKAQVLSSIWIPVFYMIALGISAGSTLFFGLMYDKYGCKGLIWAILLSCWFAPFAFLGDFYHALIGMVLWGIGMGAQRSLLKAVIGDIIPKSQRGSAYGIFNTGYGIAWFLGSWLIGYLYDISIPSLIWFSILTQVSAIPFIYWVYKKIQQL